MTADDAIDRNRRDNFGLSRSLLKAVVALVTVAIVVAALRVTLSDDPSPGAARDALLVAAGKQAAATALAPKPGEFVYRKTVQQNLSTKDQAFVRDFQTYESWTASDGKGVERNRYKLAQPADSKMPMELSFENETIRAPSNRTDSSELKVANALTGDPKHDKKVIDHEVSVRVRTVDAVASYERWALLSSLLTNQRLSSDVRADALKVMANMPGLELTVSTTDFLGRPAMMMTNECNKGIACSILFDPSTYAVLELRHIATKNSQFSPLGAVRLQSVFMRPTITKALPDGLSALEPTHN